MESYIPKKAEKIAKFKIRLNTTLLFEVELFGINQG